MCHSSVGDGKIVLEDEHDVALNNGLSPNGNGVPSKRQRTTTHPVDLELEVVLGKMPRKVFGLFSSEMAYQYEAHTWSLPHYLFYRFSSWRGWSQNWRHYVYKVTLK